MYHNQSWNDSVVLIFVSTIFVSNFRRLHLNLSSDTSEIWILCVPKTPRKYSSQICGCITILELIMRKSAKFSTCRLTQSRIPYHRDRYLENCLKLSEREMRPLKVMTWSQLLSAFGKLKRCCGYYRKLEMTRSGRRKKKQKRSSSWGTSAILVCIADLDVQVLRMMISTTCVGI